MGSIQSTDLANNANFWIATKYSETSETMAIPKLIPNRQYDNANATGVYGMNGFLISFTNRGRNNIVIKETIDKRAWF